MCKRDMDVVVLDDSSEESAPEDVIIIPDVSSPVKKKVKKTSDGKDVTYAHGDCKDGTDKNR